MDKEKSEKTSKAIRIASKRNMVRKCGEETQAMMEHGWKNSVK